MKYHVLICRNKKNMVQIITWEVQTSPLCNNSLFQEQFLLCYFENIKIQTCQLTNKMNNSVFHK